MESDKTINRRDATKLAVGGAAAVLATTMAQDAAAQDGGKDKPYTKKDAGGGGAAFTENDIATYERISALVGRAFHNATAIFFQDVLNGGQALTNTAGVAISRDDLATFVRVLDTASLAIQLLPRLQGLGGFNGDAPINGESPLPPSKEEKSLRLPYTLVRPTQNGAGALADVSVGISIGMRF